MPIRRWTVVYQSTQREEILEEGWLGSATLANFDKAAKAGRINGRPITGMWISDPAAASGILRIFGRVARDIDSLGVRP